MFAVIKTGGKQYRVVANDEFEIERIPGEAGEVVSFKEVLMVGTTIGAPFIDGATVTAEIVGQTRGPKVISFKKRRRQNSKRTRGHRQDLTMIRVGEILTDGRAPSIGTAAEDEAPAAEPTGVEAAVERQVAALETEVGEESDVGTSGAVEDAALAEGADAPRGGNAGSAG